MFKRIGVQVREGFALAAQLIEFTGFLSFLDVVFDIEQWHGASPRLQHHRLKIDGYDQETRFAGLAQIAVGLPVPVAKPRRAAWRNRWQSLRAAA
jgi:hypothetical protein